MGNVRLLLGDCLEVLPALEANSIDAIVTDPPYGLVFMGKDWDRGVPGAAFWTEALRVAKPGAHLLAFGGTRTFHRLACAIEDAGWEIRDTVMWVYGSGFPKSHSVDKAIDKAAGAEREVVGRNPNRDGRKPEGYHEGWARPWQANSASSAHLCTAPATPAAKQWAGWGTALKPAWEPIIVARKPLIGTVAANVLAWGTGALNVDGCRITTSNLQGQRPNDTLPSGGESWVQDGNLCDSCAEVAARSARPTAPARRASTAQSSVGPTSSGRGANTPGDTGKTDIGCCAGPSRGEPGHDPTGALSLSTCASGDGLTGQSPRATASIMSTATATTTASRICNLCGREITRACTAPSTRMMSNGRQSTPSEQENAAPVGRWPSNLIHDGSEEVVGLFPETGPSQVRRLNGAELIIAKGVDWRLGRRTEGGVDDNGGSAARFFKCCPLDDEDADLPRFWYVPKASKADRDEGLDGMEERPSAGAVGMQRVTARNWGDDSETVYERKTVARNHHPTVKPTALMRYLCRLITPPGGVVLDPFMGSGSTGKAAVMEGFDFMGIEVEPEYYALAEARIAHAQEQHTPQLEFAL